MDSLRIIENLDNICEHDNVALEGDLICECGNKLFKIFHSGKHTKGILAPYLVNKDNQILIEAKCTCCGYRIKLYDSSIDGNNKSNSVEKNTKQFIILNDGDEYKIHLMYNYYEENFKTNSFEECFIEISNSKLKKARRLYE